MNLPFIPERLPYPPETTAKTDSTSPSPTNRKAADGQASSPADRNAADGQASSPTPIHISGHDSQPARKVLDQQTSPPTSKPFSGHKNLTGMTFGALTVLRMTGERRNRYNVYECNCSCGRPDCRRIVYRSSRSLKNARTCDCGSPSRRARRYTDLTGRRFGMLTVLRELREPSQKIRRQTTWLCVCDCGNKVVTTKGQLTSGNRISCGCQRSIYQEKDLVGCRFGQLTVLKHEKYEGGIHFWRCRCDCGNETVVRQSSLLYNHAKSCGCLSEKNRSDFSTRYSFDGTRIVSIQGKAGQRKALKTSKSGVRGVYQNRRGVWIAQISFRGKTTYLGSFRTLEEARESREQAEKEIFDTALEAWDRLQEKKTESAGMQP